MARVIEGRDEHADEQVIVQRRTLVSIAAAALLVALKLGVGLAAGSLGLISAGVESSGDVVAAVLTFFAVRLGGRPADAGHPYGHRRAENLGALGWKLSPDELAEIDAIFARHHAITEPEGWLEDDQPAAAV